MLIKLTTGINFINILRAHFEQTIVRKMRTYNVDKIDYSSEMRQERAGANAGGKTLQCNFVLPFEERRINITFMLYSCIWISMRKKLQMF